MNRLISLAFPVAFAVSACGGGGPEGPKPLSHHFDEMYIAQVELGEKEAVLRAQNEYQKARAAHMKAQADHKESKTLLGVAKNERKQALIEEQSAQQKYKAADDSGDMTRVNAAKASLRSAEMARRAADDKVDALVAHRKYLKKYMAYTEEEMYAQEAKFELAKARLAQQKNIRPKGFEFSVYKEQADKRSQRAQRAKLLADREREKAKAAKATWQTRKKEADRAGGVSTSSSDSATP